MSETAVDRFTMDILREGFAAITDEMFVSLQRTSQSPIIYEVLDFGVGISDARGELVSQGNGVAGFLGPLSDAVRETVTRAAAGEPGRPSWQAPIGPLQPGDVIIANDPYSGGGTHLSDVAMIRPVFWADELIGFAAAKGHWTEIGGKDPGSWTADSADVYAEGLQLPFVHAFRAGQPVPDLRAIVAANCLAAGDDARRPVRVRRLPGSGRAPAARDVRPLRIRRRDPGDGRGAGPQRATGAAHAVADPPR